MSRLAVLGCGAVAAKRMAGLPGGVTVVSVFDIATDRAHSLAQSLTPHAEVATSAEEALSSGIDLAIVAAYHRELVPLSILALEAGCDVLVEKPGARNATELKRLQELAKQHGRTVRVGFNHRFHPSIIRAKELVESDKYGRLINIRGRYGHGGRPGYEREWRSDAELSGGGELLDQGVHLIDLTRHLAGDADLAFAELRTDFWDTQVEDNAFLGLRLKKDGFAWLHASWTEWKNLFSLELAFERAKIEINGLGGSYGTERLTLFEMLPEMGPPQTTTWEWPFADGSWALETHEFVERAASHRGAGVDDAVAVLDIVEAAYSYAARSRRPMASAVS